MAKKDCGCPEVDCNSEFDCDIQLQNLMRLKKEHEADPSSNLAKQRIVKKLKVYDCCCKKK